MIHLTDARFRFFSAQLSPSLYNVDYAAGQHGGWQRARSKDTSIDNGAVVLMRHATPVHVMAVNVRLDSFTWGGGGNSGATTLADAVSRESPAGCLLRLLARSREAPRRVKARFQSAVEQDTVEQSGGSVVANPVCGYVLEALFCARGKQIVAIRVFKMVSSHPRMPMRDTLLFGRRMDHNSHLQRVAQEKTPSGKRARDAVEERDDLRICDPPQLLSVYQEYGGETLFDTRALLSVATTPLASTRLPTPERMFRLGYMHCLSPELVLGVRNGKHEFRPAKGGPLAAGLDDLSVNRQHLQGQKYGHVLREYSWGGCTFDVPAVSTHVWVLPYGLCPLNTALPHEIIEAIADTTASVDAEYAHGDDDDEAQVTLDTLQAATSQ